MPTRGSPIGLGLSLPSPPTLERSSHPDLLVRQVAAPTLQLTASVAPTPSIFLPQSAQTVSLRAMRIGTQSFTNKSPVPTTKASTIDVGLVAGSVSVLVGVGGLVGVVCYRRRKRRGKINTIHQGKVWKKAHRNTGDPEDVEAIHQAMGEQHADSESRSSVSTTREVKLTELSSLSGYPNISSSLSPTPSTLSSLLPILEHAGYLPWKTHAERTSGFSPMPPSITLNADRSKSSTSHLASTAADLDTDGPEGIDVGSVALSTLHIQEEYDICGSYSGNDFSGCSACILNSQVGKSSVDVPRQSFKSYQAIDGSIIHKRLSQPHTPSLLSPTVLPGEALGHSGAEALARNSSSPARSDDVLPPALLFRPTEGPPNLLEVALLQSEFDLRMILGLDGDKAEQAKAVYSNDSLVLTMPTVPGLVSTDSQDTVTGTDESFHDNEISHLPAESCPCNQLYEPSKIPLLFKHTVKRASVMHTNDHSTIFPNVLGLPAKSQSLSSSGSSSSSTSSNSVVTLKLPSFSSSPEPTLLTEEVLPPPSIIVSVPTEASIMLRDSHECQTTGPTTWETQKRWIAKMETLREDKSKAIAQVIFDPADESEDDAWEEAYARTCFVEAGDSLAQGRMESFAGSWIMSSESSDLDLEDAVAKFPLPPNHVGGAIVKAN